MTAPTPNAALARLIYCHEHGGYCGADPALHCTTYFHVDGDGITGDVVTTPVRCGPAGHLPSTWEAAYHGLRPDGGEGGSLSERAS